MHGRQPTRRMADRVVSEVAARRPVSMGELALIYLPLFTVALGFGAILPVLPSVLERVHGATSQAALPWHTGLLTGLYIGAFVVGAPLWGMVVDRRGPRTVLVAGLLGYAAATVWFGFVSSLVAAYVSRAVAGLFAAGLLPATSAFIAANCREPERARHLGWASAASVVGFLVGPALTGWVHGVLSEARVSSSSALHVTAVPIWTTAVIAIFATVGVLWTRASPPSAGLLDRSADSEMRSPVPVARSILVLSALAAFGLGALEVGLSLQSGRAWRWSPGRLAGLFAVCGLVMLAIQFSLFAPLRNRLGPEKLVVGGFAAMAAGFALLWNSSAYGAVAVLVAVVASGSGVVLPTLSVAAADRAGAAVGTAIGYQYAASNFGQAAGSVAAGALFDAVPMMSFGIVAMVMWATAILAGWLILCGRGGRMSATLERGQRSGNEHQR